MSVERMMEFWSKATQGLKGVVWVVTFILGAFWLAIAEPRVNAKVNTLRDDIQFIKRFLYKLHPDLYKQTLDEIDQENRRWKKGDDS